MPRVLLALSRHAAYHQPESVPSAHLPYPLTQEGEAQAQRLVDEILLFARERDCLLDPVIDASPLLRAWQTASIASRRATHEFGFDMRVAEHEALTERCLGSFANMTVQEIERVLAADPRRQPLPADWKSRSDVRLPVVGAESLDQAGVRVAGHITATVRAISSRAKRDTLKVLVGHGGSIRHAAVTLGVVDRDAVATLSMHHCRPVFWQWSDGEGFKHVAGEWKARGEQRD